MGEAELGLGVNNVNQILVGGFDAGVLSHQPDTVIEGSSRVGSIWSDFNLPPEKGTINPTLEPDNHYKKYKFKRDKLVAQLREEVELSKSTKRQLGFELPDFVNDYEANTARFHREEEIAGVSGNLRELVVEAQLLSDAVRILDSRWSEVKPDQLRIEGAGIEEDAWKKGKNPVRSLAGTINRLSREAISMDQVASILRDGLGINDQFVDPDIIARMCSPSSGEMLSAVDINKNITGKLVSYMERIYLAQGVVNNTLNRHVGSQVEVVKRRKALRLLQKQLETYAAKGEQVIGEIKSKYFEVPVLDKITMLQNDLNGYLKKGPETYANRAAGEPLEEYFGLSTVSQKEYLSLVEIEKYLEYLEPAVSALSRSEQWKVSKLKESVSIRLDKLQRYREEMVKFNTDPSILTHSLPLDALMAVIKDRHLSSKTAQLDRKGKFSAFTNEATVRRQDGNLVAAYDDGREEVVTDLTQSAGKTVLSELFDIDMTAHGQYFKHSPLPYQIVFSRRDIYSRTTFASFDGLHMHDIDYVRPGGYETPLDIDLASTPHMIVVRSDGKDAFIAKLAELNDDYFYRYGGSKDSFIHQYVYFLDPNDGTSSITNELFSRFPELSKLTDFDGIEPTGTKVNVLGSREMLMQFSRRRKLNLN